MRKLNMGYAKYFNEKYERSGVLWQGTFKKILLRRDAHFLHIPFYIHLNPLDMKFPAWRDGKVRDVENVLKFLEAYRWSSYCDYNGKKNFPSILNQELLSEVLGSPGRQKRIIADIVSDPRLAMPAAKLE
jgi:putative transposase